jgi:LPS sulfotransferase NodH
MPYSPKKPVRGAVVTPAPWYAGLVPYRLRRRTKFVVVSHPRSGSNFLRHALNAHPDVFEFGEPFHANPLVSVHPRRILGKDQLPEEDVGCLVDALAREKRIVAAGFSLFSRAHGHLLDHDAAARLASRPDFCVVFLIRRNLLKAYVSHRRALRTGYYHVDPTGRPIEYKHTRPVPDAKHQPIGAIDIAEAKEWIEDTRAFLASAESAVRTSGKDFHKVYYEDLCLEGQARSLCEVNRVLGFLGLRALEAFEPRVGRTADEDFYQSIPNRKEVARMLGFDLDWK